MKKENNDKDPVELQKRIQELEKQLKAAELKAEGYELMIEIAEKELNIPIRKKPLRPSPTPSNYYLKGRGIEAFHWGVCVCYLV